MVPTLPSFTIKCFSEQFPHLMKPLDYLPLPFSIKGKWQLQQNTAKRELQHSREHSLLILVYCTERNCLMIPKSSLVGLFSYANIWLFKIQGKQNLNTLLVVSLKTPQIYISQSFFCPSPYTCDTGNILWLQDKAMIVAMCSFAAKSTAKIFWLNWAVYPLYHSLV